MTLWQSFCRQWFYPPNLISALRIIAVVAPAYLLVAGSSDSSQRLWAFVWFVLIAGTDWLDGCLARKFDWSTKWGEFLDPLADKLLALVMMVLLCYVYRFTVEGWLMLIVSLLMAAREVIVSIQIERAQHDVVPPTLLGKWKTALQSSMIATWILPLSSDWVSFRWLVTGLAVYVTIQSWYQYYERYVSTRIRPVHEDALR